MLPLSSIIGVLSFVFTSSILIENAELPINWLNNSAIQSLIGAIFDQIDHIDIVIGEHDLTNQFDHLIRREEAVFRWKSVRIYGGEILATPGGETRCTGDQPIISAKVGDVFDSLKMIDRDYSDEFSLFRWDPSYDTFAKIWDQNHHNGYMVFTNKSTFETMLKCLLDPVATYLIVLDAGEEVSLDDMSNMMHSLWIHENLFRVFFLTSERIYTFDPFELDGSRYGLLIELQDPRGIPRIPESDFNGYPLRIDIFRSTYSEPVLDASGAISYFDGADVEVSRVFTKILNFTGSIG